MKVNIHSKAIRANYLYIKRHNYMKPINITIKDLEENILTLQDTKADTLETQTC